MTALALHARDLDFYVPAFEVRLQEASLPKDVLRDIMQVTYKDDLESIDTFDIDINNWDDDKRDFKFNDSTLFNPGKKVEIRMGYRQGKSDLPVMIRGKITSLKPSFPAEGNPKLTISGQNLLHDLRIKQNTKEFFKKTDVAIFEEVTKTLKLAPEVAPGVVKQEFDYMLQDNEYDILFLLRLARRQGYELLVEEPSKGKSKLVYGPAQAGGRPTYKLVWGKSLIEFQPELSTADQVGKVTVKGWDSVNKKAIKVTVTRDQLKSKRGVGAKGGQAEIEKSFEGREEVLTNRPVSNVAEARRLATEVLSKNAREMVKGTGSTIGVTDLRAGSKVEIEGLGARYSGTYVVTSTTHTIGDGGYTTQFNCRRED